MQTLPIQELIPEIRSHLISHNKLILQAAPGAGKTTLVPLALLDELWLQNRQIVILEPRRLATRNAAGRMAQLLGEKVGERVGYQIRADRRVSAQTKIIVVTEGILTRMLQSDPALENIALIIFDEFHERNLHADLALALSLQSQELLRDDLKILVMSATINTQTLSALLNNAPVITSEGRSYPVDNIYLDSKTAHPDPKQLTHLIVTIVKEVIARESGSILIFLPGVKEIKRVTNRLHETLKDPMIHIAPLYGVMSKKDQDLAIAPAPQGERKIVIATNLAETSLTIEGITVVIDSGLQRVAIYSSASGMDTLQTISISQDAATQRSGRAGRLSPGKCYRLWHKHRHLSRHSTPEILSSDLSTMMLELAAWGVDDITQLHWLDLPNPIAITHARELLHQLGAINEKHQITQHAKAMLALGTHPRLAHMILSATELGYGDLACSVAALLSEKDIFLGDLRYAADIAERITVLQNQHRSKEIDNSALQQVLKTAKAFRAKIESLHVNHHNNALDMVGVLLGFAYPERIAKIRAVNDNRYLLSSGKGAQLHLEDSLFASSYLVLSRLDASKTNATILGAARISLAQIEMYFPERITNTQLTSWNNTQERVEVRVRRQLGSIVLHEAPSNDSCEQDVIEVLLQAIKEKGLNTLPWSKASIALRARVNFLNFYKGEGLQKVIGELPDLSDHWLLEHLDIWLAPHLKGINSFKACQKLSTHAMLLGLLTWEQQQIIDTLAPEKLEVPSGSKITINYENPQTPLLSVRLQELFGMLDTPSLIGLHVKLSIELLSPAHRPMQVTKDLRSFWESTYHEVKKELRGKYKKHYWPDNPFEAKATSKTKPKK
jgi:ATP-dependent helicase HrpB